MKFTTFFFSIAVVMFIQIAETRVIPLTTWDMGYTSETPFENFTEHPSEQAEDFSENLLRSEIFEDEFVSENPIVTENSSESFLDDHWDPKPAVVIGIVPMALFKPCPPGQILSPFGLCMKGL